MFHRRTFLQTTAALVASGFIPRGLFATTANPRFHFIHADSCTFWHVADPVSWCLANCRAPVLERAAEGLAKRTTDDADRIIRLVVRRCRLNLLELHPGHVVVHHWGQKGRADLRSFFKQHRLSRPEISVTVRDRKRESITKLIGEDFLFGDRIADSLPLDLFLTKFANRFSNEPDDWQAAPGTWAGYAWKGVKDNLIPWAALKSAWRRAALGDCLNCEAPTFLVNFGNPLTGMFSRSPRFVIACGGCRRSFTEAVKDVAGWMAANLDADVQPGYEMAWGGKVPRVRKESA